MLLGDLRDPGEGLDRTFLLDSPYAVWDASLPHVYLLVALYSLKTRNRAVGGVAALLGVKAYVASTQTYHLYWKGPTALFCFAHLYGAVKLAELGVLFLYGREDEYDYRDRGRPEPETRADRVVWALKAAVNLRCIGFKCGKTERPEHFTKSEIFFPTLIRLGLLDVCTSAIHNLVSGTSNIDYLAKPLWQQAAIISLITFSLFNVFQGTYGVFQLVSVFLFEGRASQWPPMLVRPWTATSLRQFWSKKWHAVFRRIFTFFTQILVQPIARGLQLSQATEAALSVFCVFVLSGLFHDLGLKLAFGSHSLRTFLFFAIQGPAILVEERLGISKYALVGWFWTYTVLFISGGPFGMIAFLVEKGAPSSNVFNDGFFAECSIATRLVNKLFGTSW